MSTSTHVCCPCGVDPCDANLCDDPGDVNPCDDSGDIKLNVTGLKLTMCTAIRLLTMRYYGFLIHKHGCTCLSLQEALIKFCYSLMLLHRY